MNAVVVAVSLMLILSLSRMHVVIAIILGAMAGGLVGGLSLDDTIAAFNNGLGAGATVALSYATLGAAGAPRCEVVRFHGRPCAGPGTGMSSPGPPATPRAGATWGAAALGSEPSSSA